MESAVDKWTRRIVKSGRPVTAGMKAEFLKRSKAQKARWARKKNQKNEQLATDTVLEAFRLGKKQRVIEDEKTKVQTGTSKALSSKQSLFFHDVPPELYRRIAKRYTDGHKKYSPGITQNLNWRIGIDDPLYVMDRLNHMFDHAFSFLEDGNSKDDNLGAIAWCVGFLMEVERFNPQCLEMVIKQCNHHGSFAQEYKEWLEQNQVKK